jgi:hypothetical protein
MKNIAGWLARGMAVAGLFYICMVPMAHAASSNGVTCTWNSDCASNYCYPGPENKSYCIARDANCAKPGSDGVQFGDAYSYNGNTYSCTSSGLTLTSSAPVGFNNGLSCSNNGQCASNYCYPGPENKSYCIARDANCAKPGTGGVQFGDSYTYNSVTYTCKAGTGLVSSGTVATGLNNGLTCTGNSQCASGYCYGGPENKSYCIARDANCARPGTSGAQFGESYSYNGNTYSCTLGKGLVLTSTAATGFNNGLACTSNGQCASNYCYAGPENKSYCIARDANCAKPGSDGIQFGEAYIFNNGIYQCVAGSGLTKTGTVNSGTGSCGLTDADKERVHQLLDSVLDSQRWHYIDAASSPGNYPQFIYDMQSETANVLQMAENCSDTYVLDRLASFYTIPFSHLSKDVDGNYVWVNTTTGYEEPLYSTQFMYAVAKIINVVVHTDESKWTPAMRNLMNTPRVYLATHLDRWMNKKSMWIWKECGYKESSNLREYTFPEYVSKKLARTLGYASGAPTYCNAVTEVELWVGAAATELVDADTASHYWIGLGPSLKAQLTSYAATTLDLFESRVSTTEVPSSKCTTGSCTAALFDTGAWHGHPDYPASLWPNGGEAWDFGHARRFVQFLDTMYRHPNITAPAYTESRIKTLFANAVTYLTWNGSLVDPQFTNFMNGVNVPYLSVGGYQKSAQYFRNGYALWAPYNTKLDTLNKAIKNIVETKTGTTYLTPNGMAPAGDLDLLGFYASLSHAPYEVVSVADEPDESMVANVLTAVTLGVTDMMKRVIDALFSWL